MSSNRLIRFSFLVIAFLLLGGCQTKPLSPFSEEYLATLTARALIATQIPATTTPELIVHTPTIDPAPRITNSAPASTLPPYTGDLPGQIVFACFIDNNDDICIMNPDGNGYRRLTDNPATDFYPSITPDGTYILFSSRRDNRFEAYRMLKDGSQQTRLTKDVGSVFAPVSNSANEVLFTNDVGPNQALWIVPLDGGEATELLNTGLDTIDPTWSTDGQMITFSASLTGDPQLYWASMDDLQPRQVTNLPNMGGRHSLSPDNSTFVFYAGAPNDRNIYTIRRDGSDLRQLTHGGDNLGPCWSPDGEWITFASWRDGNGEIYIMRSDGSDLRRLTNNTYSDWQPRWGP